MHLKSEESGDQSMMDMEYSVAAVESIIMYTFKDKKLLKQALTHPSFTDSPSYDQHLANLGDSAIEAAITVFFFLTYPNINVGKLSNLCAANISNEKLARAAVHHGLHKYIRHTKLSVNKVWEFFVKVEEEEKMAVYGEQMSAPRVLSDVVESIAGAVLIDCGYDRQIMWMMVKRLLEPLVMLGVILAEPQPITTLYGACGKDGKQVDIRYSKNDSPKNAKVHVAEAAQLKLTKFSSGDNVVGSQADLDFDEFMEDAGAKQKLIELCIKKRWSKPNYKVEQACDKRYISSVQVELYGTICSVKGNERTTV